VSRRAVLLFAEKTHVDLARRSFPLAAGRLLNLPAFASAFSPAIDVHLFTSAGNADVSVPRVHRQSGHGFAERFENAIETIAQLGYDEVVAVGRDCPALRALDIEHAFGELASKKLVLGPDHRGGCYLIAFRPADRELLRDVRWKRNTDCAQLLRRAGAGEVSLLPIKHDLDNWSDLRIFARTGNLLARLASFLAGLFCPSNRKLPPIVSFAARHMRVRQQIPPPELPA
jgi:2-phospho-L-lactate guanylyltransferase (CobY/MobA/RfbA family)